MDFIEINPKITEILNNQLSLYERYLCLVREENDLLSKNKFPVEVLSKKDELRKEIDLLQEKISLWQEEMVQFQSGPFFSWSEWQKSHPHDRNAFISSQIKYILAEIETMEKANQKLAENFFAKICDDLSHIMEGEKALKAYHPKKRTAEGKFIDRKE